MYEIKMYFSPINLSYVTLIIIKSAKDPRREEGKSLSPHGHGAITSIGLIFCYQQLQNWTKYMTYCFNKLDSQ